VPIDPSEIDVSPSEIALASGYSERAVREAVAAGRVRSYPVEGRKAWHRIRPHEWDADLEQLPRCTAPGCDWAGLADNGGCGTRGHAKAGRPRAPGAGLTLEHTAAARAGKLSLTRAADELKVDRVSLRRRIESGDVEADRQGRLFLLHPAEVERVKRTFRCVSPGCSGVALGSPHCGRHAGPATLAGKPRSYAARAKISAAKLGRKQPEAGRRKREMLEANSAEREALVDRLLSGQQPVREQELAALRAQGLLLRDLAGRAGRSPGQVTRWIAKGWLQVERPPRGIVNGAVIRQDEAKRFAREYFEGGDHHRQQWRDLDFVLAQARGSGRLDRLTRRSGQSERRVEAMLRDGVAELEHWLGALRGGAPKTKEEQHDAWLAEALTELTRLTELYEVQEVRLANDVGGDAMADRMPKPTLFQAARVVAARHLDDSGDPTRRVYMAITRRQKSLQTGSNRTP